MPSTVAPPPRIGETVQGPWYADPSPIAAADHAVTPPDGPAPEPAHPKPAATARTVAAGALLATLALALGLAAVSLVVAARLLIAGSPGIDVGGPTLVLLALGFALADATALALLARTCGGARNGTIALAAIVSLAWPLSGHVLIAVPLAILAVTLAVFHDITSPGGGRVTTWSAYSLLAALALIPTLAGAVSAREPEKPAPVAATTGGAVRGATATHPKPTGSKAGSRRDAAHGGAAKTGASGKAGTGSTTGAAGGTTGTAPTGAAGKKAGAAGGTTGTAPTGAGSVTGTAGATGAAPAGVAARAAAFVRAYYQDLDAQRFDAAWAGLDPRCAVGVRGLCLLEGGVRAHAREPAERARGGLGGGDDHGLASAHRARPGVCGRAALQGLVAVGALRGAFQRRRAVCGRAHRAPLRLS